MRPKGVTLILGAALILAASSPAVSQSVPYKVVNGPDEFYFGHVSFLEPGEGRRSPVILRANEDNPVPAVLNMPLLPGDVMITPEDSRMEVQFDNGTIVRLDRATELKIETILAPSLSSSQKMTNLDLRRGRVYVMYKEYSARETFQLKTPRASVKLRHNTVAMAGIGADREADVQVRYGKASVLYGSDPAALKEQAVFKGERITIGADDRFALQPFQEATEFEAWNIAINDNFEALHEGLSALPKPIRRFPKAVQYFADKYGNRFGEWIYDAYLGYVWRPFYNDHYPSGSWKPYFYGQWASAGNQMYWVPMEPWGWVPYHLGIWQWDSRRGWLWIPGSAFAPAWVDWAFFQGGLFAWRPYSLWDWMWYDDPMMFGLYGWGSGWPFDYGYGYAGGGMAYDPSGTAPAPGAKPPVTKVRRDQLAQPGRPSLELPRDFNGALKALRAGVQKKDPAVLESLRVPGQGASFVPLDKIASPRIHEHVLRPVPGTRVPAEGSGGSPLRSSSVARLAVQQMKAGTGAGAAPTSSRSKPDNSRLAGREMSPAVARLMPAPPARIHDWNPDVSLARKLGVTIRYDSGSNIVFSPELRLQSGDRWTPVRNRSGSGGSTSSGSGSSSGGSSGSSSGTSSGASSGASSGGSSSSGGGHIKKK